MRTIHAIYNGGKRTPLEPLDLPENTRVTVTLLDQDDLAPENLAEPAQGSGSMDFLNDPREDVYTNADGEAV